MVELVIAASPEKCFAAFCDVAASRHWLPDFKKLRIVRTDAAGRALEVSYEVGESLSYALVYAYDEPAKSVRWVPSAGVMDGVSGFASFSAEGEGTRFRYSVDSRRGRQPLHPETVARAFVDWVQSSGQSGATVKR